jgi:hypothetical protein
MATNFICSTSKKEQLKEYIMTVLMFWKIITRRKSTFEGVEHVVEDKWDKLCSDYFAHRKGRKHKNKKFFNND